jgi:hypothetical protein
MNERGEQNHVLSLRVGKRAAVKVTFHKAEIIARIDVPKGLPRACRKQVRRWSKKIFRKLNADKRPMRIVATSEGQIQSIGCEVNGICGIIFNENAR